MGCAFLALLLVPNLLWTRNRPKDYETCVTRESRGLRCLERTGEVLVSGLAVLMPGPDPRSGFPWALWFWAACLLMVCYELWWIRYFRSEKTMKDFYSSFLGVPVAGAVLPVAAFGALSIFGRNPLLFAAVVVLGTGHIGIHLGHAREFCQLGNDKE